MFTGLVADLGSVADIESTDDGVRLVIHTTLAREIGLGDSVAINGVCLTATAVDAQGFAADVINESLSRTSLRGVEVGGTVNVELAMRAGDRLGGHIMQGHVDGLGTVAGVVEDGFSRRVTIEAPASLLRYVVEKGSIAIDGVSLTVAAVGSDSFDVALIPETLERTNLNAARPGVVVNLEVDVLAKYVERLVAPHVAD